MATFPARKPPCVGLACGFTEGSYKDDMFWLISSEVGTPMDVINLGILTWRHTVLQDAST